MMKEKDFGQISVTEIVKKAGVGRATFYRSFKTKEEVIVYYFQHKARAFLQKQPYRARYTSDYFEVMLSIFETLKDEKEFVKLLQKARLEYLYMDYINESFMQKDTFSGGNDYLGYAYAGALYNVSMQWLKNDCKEPPKCIAEAMFIMIFSKNELEKIQSERLS